MFGYDEQAPIISVHIPKCAGSSMKNALEESFGDDAHFDYGNRIISQGPEFAALRAQRKAALIKNIDAVKKKKIIHGHFYVTKYLDVFPEAKYVTFVRHPVRLIPSYYRFLTEATRKGPLIDIAKSCKDLREFVELDLFRNIVTKVIWPLKPQDFAYIGTVENYARSLTEYSRLVGADLVEKRSNTSSSSSTPLDPEIEKRIIELNQADLEFYDAVVKAFP